MAVVEVSGTQVTRFAHDGEGERFREEAPNGGVTLYVGELQELQVAGGQVLTRTSYYYHGGMRVAMRVAGVVYFLHADHLGSVTLTTDGDGDVVARRLYRPYGATRYVTGTVESGYGYTGQMDAYYIKLVHMGARWYAPGLRRWLSADTLVPEPGNPQSLNRYAYVSGSPLLLQDPSGHMPCGPYCPGENLDHNANWGKYYFGEWNVAEQAANQETVERAVVIGLVVGGTLIVAVAAAPAVMSAASSVLASTEVLAAGGTVASAACADGDCTNEVQAVSDALCADGDCTNEISAAGRTVQHAIRWMEHDANRVEHIMAAKHGWDRLVDVSGNLMEDYGAIQPYLQQTISAVPGEQIATSGIGPVMQYVASINGQQIIVQAIELYGGVIQITNAWVQTQ